MADRSYGPSVFRRRGHDAVQVDVPPRRGSSSPWALPGWGTERGWTDKRAAGVPAELLRKAASPQVQTAAVGVHEGGLSSQHQDDGGRRPLGSACATETPSSCPSTRVGGHKVVSMKRFPGSRTTAWSCGAWTVPVGLFRHEPLERHQDQAVGKPGEVPPLAHVREAALRPTCVVVRVPED